MLPATNKNATAAVAPKTVVATLRLPGPFPFQSKGL